MDLFNGKQLPIPFILDSAVTINNYTCNLRCIGEKVEEAGILLTAYLHTKVCTSIEKQIRERQRMMHALLALSQAVHDAVDDGRLRLKRASEEHRKLFSGTPHQTPEHQPRLRVVESEQGSHE